MTNPSRAAPLFSDLRGVTVRNTFLEFEDMSADALAESGFARQSSEPAALFARQMSDRTNPEVLDEAVMEPNEGYAHLASYLTSALPHMDGGARTHSYAPDIAGNALQAALHAASMSTTQLPMHPQMPEGQLAFPRFCPQCGMAAEPNHRFCPYCCYNLQSFSTGGGSTCGVPPGAPALQQCSLPVNVDAGLSAPSSTPNLLGCLRRFRYVEASASDIELARALCLNVLQSGKAEPDGQGW